MVMKQKKVRLPCPKSTLRRVLVHGVAVEVPRDPGRHVSENAFTDQPQPLESDSGMRHEAGAYPDDWQLLAVVIPDLLEARERFQAQILRGPQFGAGLDRTRHSPRARRFRSCCTRVNQSYPINVDASSAHVRGFAISAGRDLTAFLSPIRAARVSPSRHIRSAIHQVRSATPWRAAFLSRRRSGRRASAARNTSSSTQRSSGPFRALVITP